MGYDGTIFALAAQRRAERQARQRAVADQRAAAVDDISRARKLLRDARRRRDEAEAELETLIDGDEVLVRGDAVLELNPNGGVRVRSCTQLGLLA